MVTFKSDNEYLRNEYPYNYVEPPRDYTLLTEEEISKEFEQYIPTPPPTAAGCDLSVISLQPSISETYVSVQVNIDSMS
jgi:hypothetical protein